MSQSIDRRKVDNPKHIRFSIRIDEPTLQKLSEYCEKHNTIKAVAIRDAINLLIKKK